MSSELKTNKISPATGTALQIGDSGDTITIPSGATLTNSGTATGFGKVLQVVQAVKTDGASTTSESYVTTGLEVSITPSATSSKVLVIANPVLSGGSVSNVTSQLWRDSTAIILGDTSGSKNRASSGWLYVYSAYQGTAVPVVYLDSPSSTSAITYKIVYKSNSSSYSAYINESEISADNSYYSRGASTITAMEIAG